MAAEAATLLVKNVSHRYGARTVLRAVDFAVAEGSLYALLGPNGAGKTTLLRILVGLLRPTEGEASVLGHDPQALPPEYRARVGYVAESVALPGSMTLDALEAFTSPLYPTWDPVRADELRDRFRLPRRLRIRRMSRGERMKVAVLLALASRPRVLILDEPFTGMDAVVREDLVQGVLSSVSDEGTSVLLCSHDIGELERLADHVGVLDGGRLVLSEPMDVLRDRFRQIDVLMAPGAFVDPARLPPHWLAAERAGRRVSVLVTDHGADDLEARVAEVFPSAERVDVRRASLRDVFVGLARARLGSGGDR